MPIYRYIYHLREGKMASVRTIITLSEEDKQWLESYSSLHHMSVAEAVRRGIRKLKEAEYSENYQTLVLNSKGLWKKGDGFAYQKQIRTEWDSR
jgi:hypothetical protein